MHVHQQQVTNAMHRRRPLTGGPSSLASQLTDSGRAGRTSASQTAARISLTGHRATVHGLQPTREHSLTRYGLTWTTSGSGAMMDGAACGGAA